MAESVETLLGIEKAQRLAEDVTGTRLACTAVLDVLFDAKDWPGINEHVILLSKRRSQLKQVRTLYAHIHYANRQTIVEASKASRLIKLASAVLKSRWHLVAPVGEPACAASAFNS